MRAVDVNKTSSKRLRQKDDKINALQEEIERMKAELELTKGKNKTLSDELDQKNREHHEASTRIGSLQRELTAVCTSMKDAQTMLDARGAELREAREFLATIDDVPDSEVLELVARLNSQIYQTAAGIANTPWLLLGPQALHTHFKGGDVLLHAHHHLASSGVLAPNLLQALSAFVHSQDTLLIQIALQTIAVEFFNWMCTTWDYHCPPSAVSCQLEQICGSIRTTEPQTVAGRWRALTRMHAKQLHIRIDELRQVICNILTNYIVDVLLLCGVSSAPDVTYSTIVTRFGSSVLDMVELALEIKRTTVERIISRDLLVTLAMPGEAFDAARMDDEWNDPKVTSPQGTVMSSTQLGLSKRQILHPRGGVRSEEVSTLLKPKVALHSLLDDLRKEDAQDHRVSGQGRLGVEQRGTSNPEGKHQNNPGSDSLGSEPLSRGPFRAEALSSTGVFVELNCS
ncbi:hypothetical protein GY45DRAFT_1310377 [Cubamyces sp. BRFM 1775]|nr:hypothetical protein GY45DRAFT_1310377 [Cubamyces sp. BRFM 1775]